MLSVASLFLRRVGESTNIQLAQTYGFLLLQILACVLLQLVLKVVPVRPLARTVVNAVRILTMSRWCRLVGRVGPLDDKPTLAG